MDRQALDACDQVVEGETELNAPLDIEHPEDVVDAVVAGHDLVLLLDASLMLLVAGSRGAKALADDRFLRSGGNVSVDHVGRPVLGGLALVRTEVDDRGIDRLLEDDAVQARHPALARGGDGLEGGGVAAFTGDAVLDHTLVVPAEHGIGDFGDLLDLGLAADHGVELALLQAVLLRDGDEGGAELALVELCGGDERSDVLDGDGRNGDGAGDEDAHGVSP